MSEPAQPHPETLPVGRTDEQRLQVLFEEWILLQDQGRNVSVTELCRDCPHLGETLAGEIALYQRFELPGAVEETQPALPVQEFAGLRYQPVRYHAQGGLGVVFVARDTEVGREVALKRIKDLRKHLPRERARFPREAEITGRLEHPGVVPVYSMGHDLSGQPYYTMRLVAGRTLAEAGDAFHQSGPRPDGQRNQNLRALMNRFVAVCQTIGFAHSRGVIHRDLKPGNVLLGDYGETLVIDWGLARQADSPDMEGTPGSVEAAGNGTEMGRIQGTVGFMSPEQARGDWANVGPASDVFSLGATLYALLTGRAPLCNLEDAQSGKFAPPRQVSRAVPPPLEAICRQALAAKPQDRYAEALDLAADVQRWLDDEPVQAYREPLPQRFGRWARRHRTFVAVGTVLLAVGVLGLAAGLWAVDREQARTAQALKEAKQNLDLAEANLKLAGRAIDECFNIAKQHPLFQQPRMEQARKLLLEKTLPFYRNFRAQRPNDAILQREEAEQWFRVAFIEQTLVRPSEALRAYEQARDLIVALLEAHPDVPEYQNALASTHNNLGLILQSMGKGERALQEYQEAREILANLVKTQPERPEYQDALATTYNNLGFLHGGLGQGVEAAKAYEQARALQSQLLETYPEETAYQNALARTHTNLGYLLDGLGKRAEALREYEHAQELQDKLVHARPIVAEYKFALALTLSNRGMALQTLGKRDEARRAYEQARDIQSKLVQAYPELPAYPNALARTHNNLGYLLDGLGEREEALQEYQQAHDLESRLVETQPDVPEYRNDLARTHNNRGNLLVEQGNRDEALQAYQQARDLQEKLVKDYPNVPEYQNDLARTHNNRAVLLAGFPRRDEALQAYEQAGKLQAKLVKEYPDVPEYRNALARTCCNRGTLLAAQNKREEALQEYRQADDLDGKLVGVYPEVPAYVEGLARTRLYRGELLAQMARYRDSATDLDQAITLLDKLRRLDPRNAQLPTYLLMALHGRAEVLTRLNRLRAADVDWERLYLLVPEARRPEMRRVQAISRAAVQARAADYRGAAAEVERLERTPALTGSTCYDLACVLSLAASSAAGDTSRPLPERMKNAEGYVRQAVDLLKRAHKDGYFRDAGRRAHLNVDEDLAFLRERAEYRAFVQTLAPDKP